jgi:hypothetical protein
MEIRSSLWHGTPSSGLVGGAHRRLSAHRRPPRSVRARVVRGILALALALGSIGAATAAAMGHGSSNAHPHSKVAVSNHWMY